MGRGQAGRAREPSRPYLPFPGQLATLTLQAGIAEATARIVAAAEQA
jgi:hypothetical protein